MKPIRAYLQTLYQSGIRRQFKLALHLILLTLVRKSELLLAQWPHVDFDAGEWHIPEQNSKTGKPHIVYLSRQAAELFRELKTLAGTSEWVLPGRNGPQKSFAQNALNKALNGVNIPIDPFTVHDLRRTGSTRLHEAGFAADVIEKALNHTIGGVRGIYNRAEYASQRTEMLQFWADYVDALANEKKTLPSKPVAKPSSATSRPRGEGIDRNRGINPMQNKLPMHLSPMWSAGAGTNRQQCPTAVADCTGECRPAPRRVTRTRSSTGATWPM